MRTGAMLMTAALLATNAARAADGPLPCTAAQVIGTAIVVRGGDSMGIQPGMMLGQNDLIITSHGAKSRTRKVSPTSSSLQKASKRPLLVQSKSQTLKP